MSSSGAIAPLPPQVVAQIKSSISITSLNGVAVELLKNAIDAGASRIIIQVARSKGRCVVEDNGTGIAPSEFEPGGGLAKPHHTSKHNIMNGGTFYGTYGCFLASLSALSILSIFSKHVKHHSQNAVTMFRGEVTNRQFSGTGGQNGNLTFSCGTKVTANNLFGDMPVRVKQRAAAAVDASTSLKEWEDLKKQVAALLLCCPRTVAAELKDTEAARKAKLCVTRDKKRPSSHGTAQPRVKICSVLYQTGFIPSPHTSSWANVAGSTSWLQLQGAICLDPVPTKNIQFISIGISPVTNDEGHNVLYECINRIFANSLFGVVDDLPELDDREKKRRAEDRRFKTDGYTNKELKGTGKGVDRWPIFCLKIELKDKPRIGKLHSTDDIFEDENALASITNLLQQVAIGFLTENKLMPKHAPKQRSPTKRDRYGNPVDRDGFRPQPRQVSSDTPRKRLQSAPPSATHSPRKQPDNAVRTGSLASAPLTRTASPFDIWPRVKSGRTINAPAIPKPKPSAERTVSPATFTKAGARNGNKLSLCSTPPQRPASTPVVSERPETTRSHLLQMGPIVSKEGKVLRLPFQDVAQTPAPRKDSAISLTHTKPMLSSTPTMTPRESSALEDYLNGKVTFEAFRTNTKPGIPAPSTPERSRSAPVMAEEVSGTTFTPVANPHRSPDYDRGGRHNREIGSNASGLSYMRTESWEEKYRRELLEYAEQQKRPPRNSPKRPSAREDTHPKERAPAPLQKRTTLPSVVPQLLERHTAPPETTPARKPLPQSKPKTTSPGLSPAHHETRKEPFGEEEIMKVLDYQPDDVISFKDVDGKETFINQRTGQTVASGSVSLAKRRAPRSRLSRGLPTREEKSGKEGEDKDEEKERNPSPFVMSVLRDFKNPAFKPVSGKAIPQVMNPSTSDGDSHAVLHGHKHNCSHLDIDKAFKSSTANGGEIGRLTKEGLRNATVVNQVDKKFILIKIPETTGEVLVLADQHAADERIRIESLLSSYFTPPHQFSKFCGSGYPAGGLLAGVAVQMLDVPIHFDIGVMEAQKLRMRQQWFAHWGVCFALRKAGLKGSVMVVVTAMPLGIVERCRVEPKLVIDLVRKELYALEGKSTSETALAQGKEGDWLERMHNMPASIVDLLNSRACRSAIMFNDELTEAECKELVKNLGETRFPFMCAHGRPSLVPLVEMGGLGGYDDEKGGSWSESVRELKG